MNRFAMSVSCLFVFVAFLFLSSIDADPETSVCNVTHEYQCSNGKCLSMTLANNSVNDCGDNSDEVSHPCRFPLFSCRNKRCIMTDWVLDGNNDCVDGSDEAKLIGYPCHMITNCCRCHDYVPHSKCVKGFCRCNHGYFRNDLGTKCHQRLVGTVCAKEEDCRITIENSSCVANQCLCDAGFYSSNDRSQCIRRIVGDMCNDTIDCVTVEKSHCSANATCDCISGHTNSSSSSSSDISLCVPVLINDTCRADTDCLPSPSVCLDRQCACPAGHYVTDTRDVCVIRVLGDACAFDDDCRSVIDDAVCSDGGQCACPNGRLAAASRDRLRQVCAADNSGRDIAVIATSIFVISCLVVFDVFLVVWMFRNFVDRSRIRRLNISNP